MLLNKLVLNILIQIRIALVKIRTYFPLLEKVTLTKYSLTENIETLKVNTDEAKTVKITKEDLEKSFALYEEKLIILAQTLSSQTSISYDAYNTQTKYYPLIGEDGSIKYIPITEL
ncbi:hypothetical protein [Rickettsia japonica]|uniref:Uncharacterized protein n=2 Tax=Rickettsia japonica TaxID=35790 RepID=A0AAD1CAL7_RICJA|nr:hypothetical protein [Rickettsia japonica]AXU06214.1 hypothetical protein D0Z68_01450 [Rickettsia japonica]QHE24894.1 hypothetical protein GRX81_03830 [Rickettsia japonica]BAK96415.1 hypothetical protein RJP_0194 [Rickettsia japonica YH]BAW82467.1 predicted protein [Rickettsia japonica]